MSLIAERFVWIHIPKTGGTYLPALLRNIGIKPERTNPWHVGINWLLKNKFKRIENKPICAFTRNPITWYISRWACPSHMLRIKGSQPPESMLFEKHSTIKKYYFWADAQNQEEANNFDVWMERIFKSWPGYLTWLYEFYTGENFKYLYFTGKQETYLESVAEMIRLEGLEMSVGEIEKRMPGPETYTIHKSIHEKKLKAKYPIEVLKGIIKAEAKIMDRFGYSTEPSSYSNLLKTKI